jgi:prepilin-type N-terminal cleavage/methylation domain-containing protein/prepilin-type processing-associated H-X9-DG protein
VPRRGFTLLELLVVVAIIATLVAMLLPTLGRAKQITRETLCMARLAVLVQVVHCYANDNDGFLPIGPATKMSAPMPPLPYCSIATNQLWIGPLQQPNGCGVLANLEVRNEKAFFCPGDDSTDPVEELAKLAARGPTDAYGSYLYRQVDQAEAARIESMGKNDAGEPARVLWLDLNSDMPYAPKRTNHRGQKVNLAFIDGHARSANNDEQRFSLRPQDVFNPFARLDEILQLADRLGE